MAESKFEYKLLHLIREDRASLVCTIDQQQHVIRSLKGEISRLQEENSLLRQDASLASGAAKLKTGKNETVDLLFQIAKDDEKVESRIEDHIGVQLKDLDDSHELQYFQTQYSDEDDCATIISSSPIKEMRPKRHLHSLSGILSQMIPKLENNQSFSIQACRHQVQDKVPKSKNKMVYEMDSLLQKSSIYALGSDKPDTLELIGEPNGSQNSKNDNNNSGKKKYKPDSKRLQDGICSSVELQRKSANHSLRYTRNALLETGPQTVLLQRQDTCRYLLMEIKNPDSNYKLCLKCNPITQLHWQLTDFKRNSAYVGPLKANYMLGAQGPNGSALRRVGTSKELEQAQQLFYSLANGQADKSYSYKNMLPCKGLRLPIVSDIVANSAINQTPDSKLIKANIDVSFELLPGMHRGASTPQSPPVSLKQGIELDGVLSQLHEKLASPPGLMQSEFPDTQEAQHRRHQIELRKHCRIGRRLELCKALDSNGNQCGEFIFALDVINMFIIARRYSF